MAGPPGFFETEEGLRWPSASGNPLERLRAVVDFEAFRAEPEAALPRADRSRGGRWPRSQGRSSATRTTSASTAATVPPPLCRDRRRPPRQRGAGLDPGNTGGGVWAGTAYRSRTTLALLDRRGRRAAFQRAKPRGRPLPAPIAHGNPTRARVRGLVGQVFATEKRRMGLVVRCIGLARATARITLANLVYNMRRLVWIEGRSVPA